jgi:hypothetical protein
MPIAERIVSYGIPVMESIVSPGLKTPKSATVRA